MRAPLAALALAMLHTATAGAAPYGCDASAVRGSVLGGAVIEPVTANRGAGECRTVQAGGALPAPLTASALVASTTLSGDPGRQDQQVAVAAGGIADLRLGSLPDLGLPLPLDQVDAAVDALPSVHVPLLLGSIAVDVRPAVRALVAQLGKLPKVDVLRLQGAMAYAGAACREGSAVPQGSSQVAGLTILGQVVDTNKAFEGTLKLLDTQQLDLTRIVDDPELFKLLAGPAAVDLTPLRGLLRPLVAGLPAISIPAAVAQVKVTPAEQERAGARLVQRALRVQVSALGQSVVDLVIGEAAVTAGAVDCAPPDQAVLGASEQALACTKKRLVLVDVVPSGRRVRLFGAADRSLAGRTVDLVFEGTGRRVARAQVQPDGSFRATAPLPSARLRGTNRARYQAVIGRERSLNLKLQRRMEVRSIRAAGGRVTITGRVVGPLTRPAAAITLKRRLSCRRFETVARFRPRADGTFRVTVDAPDDARSAVYRLQTTVRRTARNPKRFPTFTLPRAVDLLG